MSDLVDVVIPASAQPAAEALGLKVIRSATTGACIRRISRREAEIAVERLRAQGFLAWITTPSPDDGHPPFPNFKRAA